ncbi:hypothetical protein, partial [Staphylococcus aureus]
DARARGIRHVQGDAVLYVPPPGLGLEGGGIDAAVAELDRRGQGATVDPHLGLDETGEGE